jgi:hypothetical protein
MYTYIRVVFPVVLVFLIHYVCTHLYLHICAPPLTLTGFIQSILTTGGPICKTLLSIMKESSHLYGISILASVVLVTNAVHKLFQRAAAD